MKARFLAIVLMAACAFGARAQTAAAPVAAASAAATATASTPVTASATGTTTVAINADPKVCVPQPAVTCGEEKPVAKPAAKPASKTVAKVIVRNESANNGRLVVMKCDNSFTVIPTAEPGTTVHEARNCASAASATASAAAVVATAPTLVRVIEAPGVAPAVAAASVAATAAAAPSGGMTRSMSASAAARATVSGDVSCKVLDDKSGKILQDFLVASGNDRGIVVATGAECVEARRAYIAAKGFRQISEEILEKSSATTAAAATATVK